MELIFKFNKLWNLTNHKSKIIYKKLWEKSEMPSESAEYYNMTKFAINLNHLNKDLL
jgi:hypothetical protein